MPTQKQNINVNFAQGVNTKTDPWQVGLGQFLALENSVFDKGGQLRKRNGYGQLAISATPGSYLTTLNGNLTSVGDQVNAYSTSSSSWNNKGTFRPATVDTLPLIRNTVNQTQCDATVSANGLVCTVYTEIANLLVTTFKFAIVDGVSGQNIVVPTAIPIPTGTVNGSPRVFLLGDWFVIIVTNLNSSTTTLHYLAINSKNIFNSSGSLVYTAAVVSSTAHTPSAGLAWDGVVTAGRLFLAWNSQTGGQSIKVIYLTPPQLATGSSGSGEVSITASTAIATLMSVCADETTPSNPQIYISYYNLGTTTLRVAMVDFDLNVMFSNTLLGASLTLNNVASAAQNGLCSVFYEDNSNYSYDSAIPSHNTLLKQVTPAGSVGAEQISVDGAGLGSKAYVLNGTVYYLGAWQSALQSTYFLINGDIFTPVASPTTTSVVAKLAYENGGGYLKTGLPGVTVNGLTARISYLHKDLIAPSATLNNTKQTTSVAVYSQTGINLSTFTLETQISSAEIADNLHLGGGFLWQYDGYVPVEHNFFLWPENIECSYTSAFVVSPTAAFASGATSMVVSTAAGLGIGMSVADTTTPARITAGTVITGINGTTVSISNPTVSASTTDTMAFEGRIAAQPDGATNTNAYYYQVVYEWTDNTGRIHRSAPSIPVAVTTTGSASTGRVIVRIPSLRLTYKTANPVKIVVYRWSVANQVYYQVTSLTSPTLNDTSNNSINFIDALPDSEIVGNSIIYTTGGVVEDVNAPSSSISTLFDTRLWLVDAEDRNLLWFSKQVIEATPVEMSDLFTVYVAPSTGSQGSTGPITALAPLDDKLIIFKANAIYYINGTGPDNTGANNGYSEPIFITSTVGCDNQQSIVFMPNGLMFQSDKGIWLLGRDMSTSYVGAAVEGYTTRAVVQSALNIPETNQVRFTLDTGITLMYDYFYEQWGTFGNIPAISSCLYQGLHTYLDANGNVFQETPGMYLDGGQPVLMAFLTSWFNLASLQGFERAYYFYLLGQYFSPHKLDIGISYNYVPSIAQRVLISPDNFSSAVPSPFGATSAPFGSPANIEQWRVFFKQQKCQSFQLTVQEVSDSQYGNQPGAGFTLSGINLTIASKRGTRPIAARKSVG